MIKLHDDIECTCFMAVGALLRRRHVIVRTAQSNRAIVASAAFRWSRDDARGMAGVAFDIGMRIDKRKPIFGMIESRSDEWRSRFGLRGSGKRQKNETEYANSSQNLSDVKIPSNEVPVSNSQSHTPSSKTELVKNYSNQKMNHLTH